MVEKKNNNRNFYPHTNNTKYSPLKIFRFDAAGLTSKNALSLADSPLNSSLGGNERSTSEIPPYGEQKRSC